MEKDPVTGIYTFTTDFNIIYNCRFSQINPSLFPLLSMYDIEVFEFEFYPNRQLPKGENKQDKRVSVTITSLYNLFFSSDLRILIYICASDGKEKLRSILFQRWYNEFVSNFLKNVPFKIDKEGSILYGCIVLKNEFPHHELIEIGLSNIEDAFMEKYNDGDI